MLWFIASAHLGFVISSLVTAAMERRQADFKDAEIRRLRAQLEKAHTENAELRKWVPYRSGVLMTWGDN